MESSSSTTDVIDQMSKLDLSPIEKFAHQKGVYTESISVTTYLLTKMYLTYISYTMQT